MGTETQLTWKAKPGFGQVRKGCRTGAWQGRHAYPSTRPSQSRGAAAVVGIPPRPGGQGSPKTSAEGNLKP